MITITSQTAPSRSQFMSDAGVAPEDPAAAVLSHRVVTDVPGAQQAIDKCAGILHLVFQGSGPEVRELLRVLGVDDQLPVQCHGPLISARTDTGS